MLRKFLGVGDGADDPESRGAVGVSDEPLVRALWCANRAPHLQMRARGTSASVCIHRALLGAKLDLLNSMKDTRKMELQLCLTLIWFSISGDLRLCHHILPAPSGLASTPHKPMCPPLLPTTK